MASKSVNKVILIGNLTRDPELKYTPSGTAVCTFGVATNRAWTTAEGETKEDVQFHRVVSWQKLAELCSQILSKGRKVYLEGRITYRSYTGKDGVQRQITEIVLDDFVVFDDRRKGEETETPASPTGSGTEPTVASDEVDTTSIETISVEDEGEKKDKKTSSKKTNPTTEEISEDDIPF